MSSDVEPVAMIDHRLGNASHVVRVTLKDDDAFPLFREKVSGSQTGGSGPDDCNQRLPVAGRPCAPTFCGSWRNHSEAVLGQGEAAVELIPEYENDCVTVE